MDYIYHTLGVFFFWAIVSFVSAWTMLFLFFRVIQPKVQSMRRKAFSYYLYCAWHWMFRKKALKEFYRTKLQPVYLDKLLIYYDPTAFHPRFKTRFNSVVWDAATTVYAGKHPEWSEAEQNLTWAENRLKESSEK